MSESLETVLRLVSEGHLSPDEAEPILAALATRRMGGGTSASGAATPAEDGSQRRGWMAPPRPPSTPRGGSGSRSLHILVTENGRQAVDLRVPLGFAGLAASLVPGLSQGHADQIREAIRSGASGPIMDVRDEDGSRVLIALD
ncbi:hypothetical protein BH20CHL6_BH20CHL6_18200 [soil metagenome]|jgi:hypothetical protein